MILNLTQHAATLDQIEAGVVDLPAASRASASELLTFTQCPDADEIRARAVALATIAAYSDLLTRHGRAMIGGAPWLMGPLAAALRDRGIEPLYAFSRRESVDQVQPDGSVRKTAVFRHAGWVPAA